MERLPVSQALYSSESSKVWDELLRAVVHRICLIFHNLYKERHGTDQFANSDKNKTTAILIKLVEPLLCHGHTLCMDSFITGVSIFSEVRKGCVGTVSTEKMFLPW